MSPNPFAPKAQQASQNSDDPFADLKRSAAPGVAGQNQPKESADNFRVLCKRSEDGAIFVVLHSTDGGKTAARTDVPVDYDWLVAQVGESGAAAIADAVRKQAITPINRSRRLVAELAFMTEGKLVSAEHPQAALESVFMTATEQTYVSAGFTPAQARLAAQLQAANGRQARRY